MKTFEEILDRHHSKRFKVDGGVFVVLRPQTQTARLGSIMDISKDGLSFQYPVSCNLSFAAFSELDIFISGDGPFLNNLPIKIISDIPLSLEDPFFSTTMKRFGVEFGNITPNQASLLESFIQDHTDGYVKDRRNGKSIEKKRRWYDALQNGNSGWEKEDRRAGKDRRKPVVLEFHSVQDTPV